MTATENEVRDKAYHIGLEAEKAREAKLIESAITAAAKDSNGSVGLEDTLKAVSAHGVQTLLVEEGFFSTGYTLPALRIISPERPEKPAHLQRQYEKDTGRGGPGCPPCIAIRR